MVTAGIWNVDFGVESDHLNNHATPLVRAVFINQFEGVKYMPQ